MLVTQSQHLGPLATALAVVLSLGLAACASTSGNDDDGDDVVLADAAPRPDAAEPADAAPGTPDADVIVVADASPPDAACVPDWQPLLVNGDFDLGPAQGWLEQSMAPLVVNDQPVTADSGTYVAWLGGGDDVDDILVQENVIIPADATALRVRGKKWLATQESGAGVFDLVTVELWVTGGETLLETLVTYDDNMADAAWTAFTLPAASAHAGQNVALVLHATTDFSLPTNFFFDTLSLEAFACPVE